MKILIAEDDPLTLDALASCIEAEGFTTLQAQDGRQAIELTPRETSILHLLHQHQGKPVSRDTLLDACWGMAYFPSSCTHDHRYLLGQP